MMREGTNIHSEGGRRDTRRFAESIQRRSVACFLFATKLAAWFATRYYEWITYARANICIFAYTHAYMHAYTQYDYSRKPCRHTLKEARRL